MALLHSDNFVKDVLEILTIMSQYPWIEQAIGYVPKSQKEK